MEKELIEKNNLLQRSNTDLEQFAYVASHDLKEPLRMIGSYSTLLVNKYPLEDPDVELFSKFILDGVSHLQSLINGLLDYSRIGRADIRFKDTYIPDVIEKVKLALNSQIVASGAVITSSDMPHVKGVSSLITNLFQNLIANAIKFGKADVQPLIEIKAERQGDKYLFSVRDNGIGFSPEYEERIFGIFQRLHTRQEYEGTGIGLALCKKIVEFHKGKLWVESNPEEGSTFYFTLPAMD
jgi:chemotaxis family two-component system sensor kinase Cph1